MTVLISCPRSNETGKYKVEWWKGRMECTFISVPSEFLADLKDFTGFLRVSNLLQEIPFKVVAQLYSPRLGISVSFECILQG